MKKVWHCAAVMYTQSAYMCGVLCSFIGFGEAKTLGGWLTGFHYRTVLVYWRRSLRFFPPFHSLSHVVHNMRDWNYKVPQTNGPRHVCAYSMTCKLILVPCQSISYFVNPEIP